MANSLHRRTFLGSTACAFGYIYTPSLVTLLSSRMALGASCDSSSSSSLVEEPAFIALDLAGGGNIAGGNAIVRDKDGALLASYRGLGLPDAPNEGAINKDFGLEMHPNSGMLVGMQATADATVRAKVNGCVICTQSADDTATNPMATAPGAFLAGAEGTITPLIGTRNAGVGGSGGNSRTPFSTGVAPVFINSYEAAGQLNALGDFWGEKSKDKLERVLRLINNLSSYQIGHLVNLDLPQQVKKLVGCGYEQPINLLTGEGINLQANQDQRIGAVTGNVGNDGEMVAAVQSAYLVLAGHAGAATITMGGFDYHDGTATGGDERDQAAGRVIGMIFSMANILQRKVMIHVYSDGGVSANGSTTDIRGAPKHGWGGDAETRSAALVFIFDPNTNVENVGAGGRPEITQKQLGAYTANQGGTIDLSNDLKHAAIAESPQAHAEVVIGNWLAWQNKIENYARIDPKQVQQGDLEKDYIFVPTS